MPSPTGPATVASTSSTASASARAPSTKTALASLVAISDRHRFLVVLERTDAVTWLSLRNAPEVHIVAVDQLNTYDVLASDDVVFTQGAFDAFVSGAAGTSERKATVVEAPADDAVVDAEAEEKPAAKKAAAKKAAKKTSGPKNDAEAWPRHWPTGATSSPAP